MTKVGLVTGLIGAIVLAPLSPACAQDLDTAKVRKVHAAYLFNFAKFIQWPKGAIDGEHAEFIIGVLGDDRMGKILESTLKSKTLASRPIVIRRYEQLSNENYSSIRECQVVYLGKSQESRLQSILLSLRGRPILLVSEISGFARKGGMIGFVLEEGRIVFEIKRSVLAGAGLQASSKLLRLARLVIER